VELVSGKGGQHGTTWGDSKAVLDENGVLDKFNSLRRNNSMDFEPAMNENGVLDKFKILRRITLMDFEAAIVE